MSTLLCIDAHISDNRLAVVVDARGITDGLFWRARLTIPVRRCGHLPGHGAPLWVSRRYPDVCQRNACGGALWGAIGLVSGGG